MKTWKELSYRDKVAHSTSIASFCLGWLIAIAGLIMPPMGEVNPSVITIFGIAIGYTGAMYGIIKYVKDASSENYKNTLDAVVSYLNQKHDESNK